MPASKADDKKTIKTSKTSTKISKTANSDAEFKKALVRALKDGSSDAGKALASLRKK